MRNLFIIGVGMGHYNLLTQEAIDTINNSDVVFAFGRIAGSLSVKISGIVLTEYKELKNSILAHKAQNISVLVSGDVGYFSASKALQNYLQNDFVIKRICGINSLQYLCGKLNLSYENTKNVSLHGRGNLYTLLGAITHNESTFVLCGGENNAAYILEFLKDNISDDIVVVLGENLSAQNELILQGSIAELAGGKYSELAVLLFLNRKPTAKGKVYFDVDFARNKTPMTKQHVRWISTNTLDIAPNDIVFDIGAGTGSIAIEMAAKAHEGVVFAIERKEEAYSILCENTKNLRAFNVLAQYGSAEEIIKKLPVPNKVFIGGSNGQLIEILNYLYAQNPEVVIVINAVTIETLTQACAAFEQNKKQYSVMCVNSSHTKQMQNYHMLMANNPIYIITGTENGD